MNIEKQHQCSIEDCNNKATHTIEIENQYHLCDTHYWKMYLRIELGRGRLNLKGDIILPAKKR